MKRFFAPLVLFGLLGGAASAQSVSGVVVSACGTPPGTYVAGQIFPLTVDTTGKLCDTGSGGTTSTVQITGAAGANAITPVAAATGVSGGANTLPVSIYTNQTLGVTYSTTLSNPTSVLTRAANTTAYAAGQAVASSTTAGSAVIPSVSIAGGGFTGASIPKMTLATNATTGWGAVTMQVDLWRAAPTLTNGDGGAYLIATGSANFLGSYFVTLTQAGDGAYGELVPVYGTSNWVKLASGSTIYWTAKINTAATPISSQTFTITPQVLN